MSKKVSRKRHLLKTVSWRFIATIDTVLLAFLITGDITSGLKIGGLEVLTKMFLYYGHERMWWKIDVGLDNRHKLTKQALEKVKNLRKAA